MKPDGPMNRRCRPTTSAIHAGEPAARQGQPVVPPVVRSSTFHWWGAGDGAELRYSRYGNNPNQESVAAKIAALEGTEAALALASGMAATAMTLLSVVEAGDHVVASRYLYGATQVLLADELPRRGVTTTFVDPDDPAAWRAALSPRTGVVLIELPTNPTLKVFDIEPARRAAQEAGAILAADVTFATPINLRAAEHGVDAVIHSATKYLGGHSDLIAGVVAGSRTLIDGVTRMMKLYGASIDPETAWLLERGIRTLPVRMERHNRSAHALAEWFTGVAGVRQVIYPGLATHPDHACASRMLDGYGGMVSIVLRRRRRGSRPFLCQPEAGGRGGVVGWGRDPGVPAALHLAREPEPRGTRGARHLRRAGTHLGRSRRPGRPQDRIFSSGRRCPSWRLTAAPGRLGGLRGPHRIARCVAPAGSRALLPSADESAQQRHREGVPAMSVLVHQSLGREGDEHLVDVAAAERFVQDAFGCFDHFLDGEFIVAVLKSGDCEQQLPLPIGSPSPSPREEVGVELLLNLRDGYYGLLPSIDPLNEGVVHLTADELNEVRIAA